MKHPPDEMESDMRDASHRSQDTMKRSFQRKLRYFKDSLNSCYLIYRKCYMLVNGKKTRLNAGFNIPILCALDEYSWLYNTHADNFYGLGRHKEYYVLFSFKYDMMEEPNVKVIIATTREALISEAMNERIYRRYIKDTTPI